MRLGVCWYPEQEDPSSWAGSVAMMADEGLEVVRIAEFAWAGFEPQRDQFDWGWLDDVVELLATHDRRIVLCTPTAAPPRWLTAERPEILLVGPSGRPRQPGSRRHVSLGSPVYRDESRRITTLLAERYGNHSAVEAWQLDNEVGNHDSARCWADHTQGRFGEWLRRRHGTIEELNRRWGTAFWSGTYASFDDVELPVPTMTSHNPALLLAHRRFASAEAVAFVAEQAAIVRSGSPGRAVLVNEELGDVVVDVFDLGRVVDTIAHDNYPHGSAEPYEVALRHRLVSGATGDGRGWIVEQQPGQINWTATNPPVAEGDVRRWCWQALHHGIDTLCFFRWRAARFGQEQYHSGLLRHDGTLDQGLMEVREFRAEVAKARPERLGRAAATAALLFAYDDAWAIEIQPHHRAVTHRRLVTAAMEATSRLGVDVDIVEPDADLSAYQLVLAPAMHLATATRIGQLHAALDAGAHVVVGPRSLVKDDEHAWVDEAIPAGLAERLGARVDAFAGWDPGRSPPVAPWEVDAGCWTDVLAPLDCATPEVVATYASGTLAGRAAVVRNGRLTYVGAASADVWTHVLADLLGCAPAPHGVEVFAGRHGPVELDHRGRLCDE